MTIVLIIAHAPLASSLKAVAEHAYPDATVSLYALDVASDATGESVAAQARACIERCGDVDVLVFADAYGATPCRGAMLLLDSPRVRVVAGAALDRKGQPMTMLLKGTVEPYLETES